MVDIKLTHNQIDITILALNDFGALSVMLVETKKHVTYPSIYLLIKLVLIILVAIASVKIVFSGMTCVKNSLRNSMCDQLLNDCLVIFIEKMCSYKFPMMMSWIDSRK
ncbi:hypothetical protein ACS0TY_020615 [Phlomoides rotata]